METVTEQVGRRIMLRRTLLRIRQGELATKAGLSQSHLSNMEQGARSIDLEKLAAISRALNCKIADLLPESEGGQKAA
ncbi:MAG TPA: helix-turn-helix transcriptional regulator [Candidatus Competibacter sp.]|jgi:transcriptional regulator with XRE-family HTH domain|uniref:XRE family transcriptional regulator n=1 Tax=Candidatus Competibacter phosphatis TaxID=221280 RepID=A0ABX1TNP5_9GAMM|nr:helix-turn-helix transcriptional regulator [Candidatus Competibacter phosphatis]MCP5449729.1 helix-turn-helix transcriptional regulator [Gammaproteobacteria bacterium]HPE72931.1 helix-turn-helix transcriptional regulator [Candidatus Competibacter sp.]MCP5449772.1 helix-turn-helix transcriptional regulator [Gammaproteobacteria bacterium]NMQ21053.1 XRE family transcriptional regulator [Candidatus Competibacter phosphatis]HRE55897.1 helix-turn-helix transcriptional regulator [Candidatus Compet